MKGIAMNEDERASYNAAWDIPEDENDGYVTDNEIDINNILDGTTRLDFSHAGGNSSTSWRKNCISKAGMYSHFRSFCLFTF
jgi:hypothetical protein